MFLNNQVIHLPKGCSDHLPIMNDLLWHDESEISRRMKKNQLSGSSIYG